MNAVTDKKAAYGGNAAARCTAAERHHTDRASGQSVVLRGELRPPDIFKRQIGVIA